LDPSGVLDQLEFNENMVVADFGSGSGGWTIPLAKKLKKGAIFAVDILPEPLSALESRAKIENIANIRSVKADAEDKNGIAVISAGSLDWVLMTNLLFQAEDKNQIFVEAKRVLKPGGKILVIEWRSDVVLGPVKKVSPEEVKRLASANGFTVEKDLAAGRYHYGIVLVK